MDKLLTLSQAAELISVHPETLRRWDREEKLIAVKVNDRGDRRYRESDVLKLVGINPESMKLNSEEYGGYTITWDSDGFLSMPGNFGLIARIIAKNKDGFTGFAFAVSGLSSFERVGEGDDLKKIATDCVKKYIDTNSISAEDIYTFEFSDGKFIEVQNPEWWQGKYTKTLCSGLRLEANHSCPVTMDMKAWRVILNFKTKQGDLWLTTGFGSENNRYEYYLWIDSESLRIKGLSNTSKSAEILAVETVKKRFENTRIDDIRDISRINETNSAIYLGKTMTGDMLPDKFYSK
jgi:hypothetical protein